MAILFFYFLFFFVLFLKNDHFHRTFFLSVIFFFFLFTLFFFFFVLVSDRLQVQRSFSDSNMRKTMNEEAGELNESFLRLSIKSPTRETEMEISPDLPHTATPALLKPSSQKKKTNSYFLNGVWKKTNNPGVMIPEASDPPPLPSLEKVGSMQVESEGYSDSDSNDDNSVERVENNLGPLASKVAEFIRASSIDHLVDFAELNFIRKIGEGAFAVVWEAEWGDRVVAAKVMKRDRKRALSCFVREVSALGKCRYNPHAIRYYGACSEPVFCLVVEKMDCSLYDALHKKSLGVQFTKQELLRFAVEISDGVRRMHALRPPLVHRDLSSENVLVDLANRKCKISDFGITKEKYEKGAVSWSPIGHPRWRAPEVTRHEKYGKSVDIFSFGTVLWELMTGQVPFGDVESGREVATRIAQGERLNIPSDVDPAIADVIRSCWSPNPEQRPTMRQVASKLSRLLKKMKKTSTLTKKSSFLAKISGNIPILGPPPSSSASTAASSSASTSATSPPTTNDKNHSPRPNNAPAFPGIPTWSQSEKPFTLRSSSKTKKEQKEKSKSSHRRMAPIKIVSQRKQGPSSITSNQSNSLLRPSDSRKAVEAPPLPSHAPPAAPSVTSASRKARYQAIALGDYQARSPGELSFVEGDKILILATGSNGWAKGHVLRTGQVGFFPLKPKRPHMEAIALSNYQARNPAQLSFHRGDRIKVLGAAEEKGWARGEVVRTGFVGLFPKAATELIRKDKPKPKPPKARTAVAIESYQGRNPGELTFEKGDFISVLGVGSKAWAKGRLLRTGEIGLFPKAAAELVKSKKRASPHVSEAESEEPPTKNRRKTPRDSPSPSPNSGLTLSPVPIEDDSWASEDSSSVSASTGELLPPHIRVSKSPRRHSAHLRSYAASSSSYESSYSPRRTLSVHAPSRGHSNRSRDRTRRRHSNVPRAIRPSSRSCDEVHRKLARSIEEWSSESESTPSWYDTLQQSDDTSFELSSFSHDATDDPNARNQFFTSSQGGFNEYGSNISRRLKASHDMVVETDEEDDSAEESSG